MSTLARLVIARALQQNIVTAVPVPAPARGDHATAVKLRDLANSLSDKIDYKMRPMTQNHTPKRGKQFLQRMHEGRNLKRAQQALRVLAGLHERGECPPTLAGLRQVSEVLPLVSTKHASDGYYDYHELPDQFGKDTPQAELLRELVSEHGSGPVVDPQQVKVDRMMNDLRSCNIPGFFPTPPAVIDRMLELAEMPDDSCVVLEPSAGAGHILDRLAAAPESSKWLVYAYEINPQLRELLKAKGYPVTGRSPRFPTNDAAGVLHNAEDFMQHAPFACHKYDRILMNPPFEKDQDMKHVRTAYDVLRPGGVLVAVMSIGWRFRTTGEAPHFREFVQTLTPHFREVVQTLTSWEWEELPDDAFNNADAFRRTGVKCGILKIRKAT